MDTIRIGIATCLYDDMRSRIDRRGRTAAGDCDERVPRYLAAFNAAQPITPHAVVIELPEECGPLLADDLNHRYEFHKTTRVSAYRDAAPDPKVRRAAVLALALLAAHGIAV